VHYIYVIICLYVEGSCTKQRSCRSSESLITKAFKHDRAHILPATVKILDTTARGDAIAVAASPKQGVQEISGTRRTARAVADLGNGEAVSGRGFGERRRGFFEAFRTKGQGA